MDRDLWTVLAVIFVGGFLIVAAFWVLPRAVQETPRENPLIAAQTKTIESPDLSAPDRAQAHIERAKLYRAAGQYDKAVADYRAAIHYEPPGSSYVDSLEVEIVETWIEKGDLKSAMTDWRSYSAEPHHGYSSLLLRAKIHAASNDPRELADLNSAVAMMPGNPDAYVQRSDYFDRRGEYDKALADIETVHRLVPGWRDYHDKRLGVELHSGSLIAAWSDFSATMQEAQALEQTKALETKAQAEFDSQDLKRGIADYTALIAHDPKNVDYRMNRGDLYVWSGDTDRGLADLKEAVFEQETQSDPHLRLAQAYSSLFRFEDSLPEYRLAIVYSETPGRLRRIRGFTDLAMDRLDDAIADFSAGHAEDPQDIYSVIGLHLAKLRARRDDKAEFVANAAAVDDGDWPTPLLRYTAGTIDRAELLKQARLDDGDDNDDPASLDICEMNDTIGTLALARGDRVAAMPALQAAAKSCRPGLIERWESQWELNRITLRG
ncbi:MAG: tetratricopeptide repeat protein [Rhizomicrobium sp.]